MKKLGFGLMRLPLVDPQDSSTIDIERFKTMVDEFLANGFTYFDTAYPYHRGKSEEAFKEAVVRRYPRDAYTVTDKMPMFSVKEEAQLEEIFRTQLERLGVDYIDYYWLHALGKASYETSIRVHAFDFIMKKKEEGKVKHIGFSYHDDAELLDKILTEHPEVEYVQLQLNYIDWKDATVQAEACYNVCVKHNKPVIVMEPVKGGALANVPPAAEKLFKEENPDMSAASWAIRYAASKDNVLTVLSGMSTEEQLCDNIGYMKDFIPLNGKEEEIIKKAEKIIRESIAIPCTACRYCVDVCPKKIPIPDCFAIYNNLKAFGDVQRIVAFTYYGNITEGNGKASDCLSCGACESICPQHLPIRRHLSDVAATFEKKK